MKVPEGLQANGRGADHTRRQPCRSIPDAPRPHGEQPQRLVAAVRASSKRTTAIALGTSRRCVVFENGACAYPVSPVGRASSLWKPTRLWEPSQKGLLEDAPQRHNATSGLSDGKGISSPSASTRRKAGGSTRGPSRRQRIVSTSS